MTDPIAPSIAKAVQLLERGDFVNAGSVASALGDDPDALHVLALIRCQQNQPAEALDFFNRSLARRPGHPHVLTNLGKTLKLLGRHAEAIAAFNAALDGKPDLADALAEIGQLHYAAGDYAKAEAPLREALERAPSHAEAKLWLGMTLRDSGRLAQAQALLGEGLMEARESSLKAAFMTALSSARKGGQSPEQSPPTPHSLSRNVKSFLVSGRELFICDGFIAPSDVLAVESCARSLDFARRETSLLGMAPTASSAEIPVTPLMKRFIAQLQAVAEEVFPGEQFLPKRAYVNHSIYGDAYNMHRDHSLVTALYYVNLVWEPDWSGDTIYYDDDYDAQIVVSPRPGRLVVSRGAILHRGSVPARECKEARLTIAVKFDARG